MNSRSKEMKYLLDIVREMMNYGITPRDVVQSIFQNMFAAKMNGSWNIDPLLIKPEEEKPTIYWCTPGESFEKENHNEDNH